MRTLDCFDFKGHSWSLIVPPVKYTVNKYGLTEAWMLVEDFPPTNEMIRYAMIPHPVFTEWWET